MRRMLLAGEVMDVLYYTHMLACNTLMASGDVTLVEYLILLDAAVLKVATPRELSRVSIFEPAAWDHAAERLAQAGLLSRTRSPLDRRRAGFSATAEGRRRALLLNRLMRTVACDFWRTDEAGIARLVAAVEPFSCKAERSWPVSDEAPVSLRSLCALATLWYDYRSYAASFLLTVSELHMLMITDQFGAQPDHPLYRDRNMFATNDYASNVMLAEGKGLLTRDGGSFALSDAGREKVRLLWEGCEPTTVHKDVRADDGPLPRLAQLCAEMTAHAMANGTDLYRGTVE